MTTVWYDRRFLDHDTRGMAEGPERLERIWKVLDTEGLPPGCRVYQPSAATREQVERIHQPEVLDRLTALAKSGGGVLDMAPTVVGPASPGAAFLAAGAAIKALEHACSGDPALALVRPPGHHATPSRSMGFCLFNNLAVAVADLLARALCERVLIVDFDLHHGNGTQDAFADEARVRFVSLHQFPIYPGSGGWPEPGRRLSPTAPVNVPFPTGAGDRTYLAALEQIIVPLARRFRPDFIALSCGYDAHWAERAALGAGLQLTVAGYYRLVSRLRELAFEVCANRIAGVLEGGYHLDALAWGVLNTLQALGAEPFRPDPLGPAQQPETDCGPIISRARALYRLD